jgi:hypothetical protein
MAKTSANPKLYRQYASFKGRWCNGSTVVSKPLISVRVWSGPPAKHFFLSSSGTAGPQDLFPELSRDLPGHWRPGRLKGRANGVQILELLLKRSVHSTSCAYPGEYRNAGHLTVKHKWGEGGCWFAARVCYTRFGSRRMRVRFSLAPLAFRQTTVYVPSGIGFPVNSLLPL